MYTLTYIYTTYSYKLLTRSISVCLQLLELRSGSEPATLSARAKLAKEYRQSTPEERRVRYIC